MPKYTYDPRLRNGKGGYRDARGQIVSEKHVRESLFDYIDNSDMVTVTRDLQSGDIGVREWQRAMREYIKDQHINAVAVEAGGWSQMAQSDFGRAGAYIKQEYGHLDKWAAQIASGEIPLDGRLVQRARLYDNATYMTYSHSERARAELSGMIEEISILDPAVVDHCAGCIDAAARGWVPIGTLPRIGARDCFSNDRCHFEYR